MLIKKTVRSDSKTKPSLNGDGLLVVGKCTESDKHTYIHTWDEYILSFVHLLLAFALNLSYLGKQRVGTIHAISVY